MLTRRAFLKTSSLLALAPTIPAFLARVGFAAEPDKDGRVLVVVQLDGGNDALNTVVPHADSAYEQLRPKLKIAKKDLITVSDTLGLHPSLRPLAKLVEAGQLATLPGVGYPNPNRSHFESMAIWHTARFDKEERKGYGWLGRALDPAAATSYAIGAAVPGALRGRRSSAVALNRAEEVLLNDPSLNKAPPGEAGEDVLSYVRRQSADAEAAAGKLAKLAGNEDGGRYPATGLGGRLKLIARLLKADLGSRVFYTVQGGYDTHASQQFQHANLLNEYAGAVAAFFEDLTNAKLAERVTLLTFSEFGRTIKENGSVGTDHGTAGVVFLAGPGVKGGVAGTMPSLTELVEGEPKMTTDFRSVYGTVLEDWMGIKSQAALGEEMGRLPLFAK